jgi:hypothetical protein
MLDDGKRITVEVYGESAVIHCPACFRSIKARVPLAIKNTIAVCKTCQHRWNIAFERILNNRRMAFRKPCNIPGYVVIGNTRAQIRITEVSVTSISFTCKTNHCLTIGSRCMVTFILPNRYQTEVSAEITIRTKTKDVYGAEFLNVVPYSDIAKKIHFWIQSP